MSLPASIPQDDHTQLIIDFLQAAHAATPDLSHAMVDDNVKCWGFPEFSPQNRNEYFGFFNYLSDVFAQMDFQIEQCLADASQVLVRFRITGIHHEEFMGLPATYSQLSFSANSLFRLENRVIKEVWMYDKKVSLITRKGTTYQLNDRLVDNSCNKAAS